MIMKIISITIIALFLFACNSKKQQANDKDMADMKMPAPSAGVDTNKQNKKDNMEGMPTMGNDSVTNKMDMKPMKDVVSGSSTNAIKLSDQQVQLGNILTDTINSGMLGDKIVLTATLNINQMKTTSISARVMGRIEKLYFKNMGDYVKKGDRLFDLYSEELNNAKQELILALERKNILDNSIIDFNQLIQSSNLYFALCMSWLKSIMELSRIFFRSRASTNSCLALFSSSLYR